MKKIKTFVIITQHQAISRETVCHANEKLENDCIYSTTTTAYITIKQNNKSQRISTKLQKYFPYINIASTYSIIQL